MKKILYSFIIFLALFVFVNKGFVLASRTDFSTSQKCDIEGVIKSVEYKEAFRDPCLEEGVCPVGAYNPETPAKYNLSVLVESVSCTPFDGMSAPKSYEEHFPIGEEQIIFVEEKDVLEDDSFVLGQKILGKVEWFFGNKFISYKLKEDNNSNQKNNKIVDEEILGEPNSITNPCWIGKPRIFWFLCEFQFYQNHPGIFYLFTGLIVVVIFVLSYIIFKLKRRKK